MSHGRGVRSSDEINTRLLGGERQTGSFLRLGSNGERLRSVGTPRCCTSTRSSRIQRQLVAISICILAFLGSPALALADNGNGNGDGNAAATSTTSVPDAATTTSSSDPTTTTSAHNASPAPSAPVTPDPQTNTSAADTAAAE